MDLRHVIALTAALDRFNAGMAGIQAQRRCIEAEAVMRRECSVRGRTAEEGAR